MPPMLEFSDDELIELSFLRDLETDQLIEEHLLSEDTRLSSPLDDETSFKYEELSLHVTAGSLYPVLSATFQVDNYALPRESIIELRARLRGIVEDAESTNNLAAWLERNSESSSGIFEPTMVVLGLAKETRKHLDAFRTKERARLSSSYPLLPFQMKQAAPSFSSGRMALQYLQKTAQQIAERIPHPFQVLHIEEVLRGDLARAFDRRQQQLRDVLLHQPLSSLRRHVPSQLQHSKRKEDLVDYLVRPRMTFHGTQRQFVPSIVRHGFLKPGATNPSTNSAHEVRCGSTYGAGIYSSPNVDFSLSYTDWTCHATKPDEYFGVKLIVCATIMGRSRMMLREDNWRLQSEPYANADSHVGNRELEYIVFDPAQIMPIYIIHMDWGRDNISHFQNLPADPKDWIKPTWKLHPKLKDDDTRWPGEVKTAKQAVYARATKYFPYGFGPATGGKFVVEEVGEVDEDEEEYGDYQALRGEEIKDKTNLDFWSWVKAAEEEKEEASGNLLADEYSHAKRAFGPVSWDSIPAPVVLGEESDDRRESAKDDEEDFGLGRLMM